MGRLKRMSRPRSVTDRTYDRIKEAIVTNAFAPGQVLAAEPLARELGVSRTPVRDALLMLRNEGFVEGEAVRGKGMVVADLRLADLDELFELRFAIEAGALALVVKRANPATLRQLRADLERHREPNDDAAASAASLADLAFHRGIVRATGNASFLRCWDQLATQLQRYWDAGRAIPGRAREDIEESLAIVDALIDGDVGTATERLAAHLANTQVGITAWHRRPRDATGT